MGCQAWEKESKREGRGVWIEREREKGDEEREEEKKRENIY